MAKRRELTEAEKQDAQRLYSAFERYKLSHPEATQESLADECGWKTQGAVSQYLTGKVKLNPTALSKFCRVLGVSPREISPKLSEILIANTDKSVMEPQDNSVITDKSINSRAGGNALFLPLSTENPPMLKGEKAINWRESIEQYQLGTDEGMIKNIPLTPATFGFDVVGDEMAPDFKDGERVSIDPEKQPEDLKFALVEIDGDLAIRRLRRINGEWWLVLSNPSYADLKKPLSEARLIGMVTSKVEVTLY